MNKFTIYLISLFIILGSLYSCSLENIELDPPEPHQNLDSEKVEEKAPEECRKVDLNPFPVLRGNFCLTNNTYKGRLIEFVHKITRNSGNILYFDDVVIQNYCDPHENNLYLSEYVYDSGNYVKKKIMIYQWVQLIMITKVG